MRAVFRLFSLLFAVVLLLVLGFAGLFILLPDDTRKQWVVAVASYALDREVAIDGEFSMDFGKSIKLHTTQLAVANASWGAQPALYTADAVDAEIWLMPLLSGVVKFSLLTTTPRLMLETSPTGTGNWEFGNPADSTEDTDWPLTFKPHQLSVTDGYFSYSIPETSQMDEVHIKHLVFTGLGGERTLELQGNYNTLPLSLKTERSAGDERDGAPNDRLTLKGLLGKLAIRGDGSIKGAFNQGEPAVDMEIHVEAPSLRFIDGQLGKLLPDIGPIKGTGRLRGGLSAVSLDDIKLALNSKKGSMELSGSIAEVLDLSGFQLQGAAQTSELIELLKVFSVHLPHRLPPKVSVTAKLSGDWPELLLGDISGKMTDDVTSVSFDGKIVDLLNLDDADFRLELKSPSLVDIMAYQRLQEKLPGIGPVTGTSHVTARKGMWSASATRLDAENKDGWFRYRSDIKDLFGFRGINMELSAKLHSLEILQLEKLPGIGQVGSVDIHVTLKDNPATAGEMLFNANIGSDKLKLLADGRLSDLLTENTLSFNFQAGADQLSDIGGLLGHELPAVGPVELAGKLTHSGQDIHLDQFAARAGNTDLAGQLTVRVSDKAVKTNQLPAGQLKSRVLDLRELFPPSEPTLTVVENQELVEVDQAADTANYDRVFSSLPLPFDWLRGFHTRLDLQADSVQALWADVDDLKATFSVANGVLEVQPFSVQVDKEIISLALMLDASSTPASFTFTLDGERVSLLHASTAVTHLGLDGGEAYFHVDVKGKGASVADIFAGLDGSIAFGVVGSQLENVPASNLGASLLDRVNPVTKQGDRNRLECTAIYFDVEEGVASTPRGIAAQFEDVTWMGAGEINLATERIQISAKPNARKGLGISLNQLAKLVLIGGTLANPQIQIDPIGVVGAYANYAAAISTGGLSLILVGLVEKSVANDRVCLRIMDPEAVESLQGSPDILNQANKVINPKTSGGRKGINEILDH